MVPDSYAIGMDQLIWVVTRFLAGDDSVLRYDIGTVADMGQSGSGVRLTAPDRGIQKVKLYRYR
jgi:hypothetical protein